MDLAGLEMGLSVCGGTGGLPPFYLIKLHGFSANNESVVCNTCLMLGCSDYMLYLYLEILYSHVHNCIGKERVLMGVISRNCARNSFFLSSCLVYACEEFS